MVIMMAAHTQLDVIQDDISSAESDLPSTDPLANREGAFGSKLVPIERAIIISYYLSSHPFTGI